MRTLSRNGIGVGHTWSMRNEAKRLFANGDLSIAPQLRGLYWDDIEQYIYEGEIALDKDKRLVPIVGGASRQYWQETLWWATNTGTAVANSTTETIAFPDVTIPGNYMQDGRSLAIRVIGSHSTLGSGTVTLVFRFRWGGVSGTLICATPTITTLISAANWLWNVDVEIQTRTNGSTGTIEGNGIVHVHSGTAPTVGSATGSPAEAPMTAGGGTAPATATGDLTNDTALSFTVQHGAASASNTVTGRQYTGKSLN